LIQVQSLTSGIGNYTISISLNGNGYLQSKGSIWDITVVSGSTGINLGTTTLVSYANFGAGTVSGIVSGNGTFNIGITDLLEQYGGATDTLPGYLGNANLNGGSVGFTYSTFSFAASVTPAPEPGSLGLFVGGIATLGAMRHRRRG
jgi:hypothetical protein